MPNPPNNDTTSDISNDKQFDKLQLSTLVDMASPDAVHKEALHILHLMNPEFDTEQIDRVFKFTVDLYEGHLKEYKACNTDYHNLKHITDTYLAMARLLHGLQLSNGGYNDSEIILGLVSALMHDTGMIQESTDYEGTGAQYTQDHVQLSMDFVEKHAAILGLDNQEISDMRDMILCTDLMVDIQSINFTSEKIEHLGKILGTADLIAQMADRTYLEKLLFLYHEFREAEMGNYKDEVDFLYQTLNFFETSLTRFKETLDNVCSYMVPHFKARWDTHENLYILSIEKQRVFLEKILEEKGKSVYQELKRDSIVQKVRKKFGKTGLAE
jgi:hypothetical protein